MTTANNNFHNTAHAAAWAEYYGEIANDDDCDNKNYRAECYDEAMPELTEVIVEKPQPKVQQRGPRGSGSLWELQQMCMNRTKYLVCGKCTSTCQCR